MENLKPVEILLVEDNPSDVKLAKKALEKYNLANNILVVHDGEEALDYFYSRGKFQTNEMREKLKLVLLDLKLPKVNGLEVLKQIKSDENLRTIPVVILTSSKEERDIIEGYRYGVNSYIVKPVDFEQFTKAVADLGLYWLVLNELPTR